MRTLPTKHEMEKAALAAQILSGMLSYDQNKGRMLCDYVTNKQLALQAVELAEIIIKASEVN